jgi:tRNA(Ile)-lysidine synthase
VLTAPPGEFSGLFSPFDIAVRGSVIAAVSGGSDSTALLLLLKGYIDQFSPGTRLVAVTIDHALRRESAEEAAAVARLSASIGVPHRILTWTGDKPSTGLAAAARETRHDLLAEAALAEKTDLVFTGHTADDQAETVLMRQARDARDGERGLAGIAPATLFDGKVWFARPLLATRREALRSFLRRKQIGWIDDPTNLNQRYERPRVRKRLSEAGGETAIADALRIASEAARKRHELGVEAAELIQLHADRPAAGLLRLHPDFFREHDAEPAVYALRVLLGATGGTPHLPDQARTIALHARLAASERLRSVLSRTLVDKRKAGVFLLREARGLPEAQPLRSGSVWDGRYVIADASPGFSAGPPSSDIPDSIVRLAAAVQPALPAALEAIPILAPWARYLPSFDLTPARAVAELVGGPPIPSRPFQEHIESKA